MFPINVICDDSETVTTNIIGGGRGKSPLSQARWRLIRANEIAVCVSQ